MIIWSNGKEDNRRVIEITGSKNQTDLKSYAYVIDDNNNIEEVVIDNSTSSGILEPIYGGELYDYIKIDGTDEDKVLLDEYLFKKFRLGKTPLNPKKGEIVKVVSGRKHRGETLTIKESFVWSTHHIKVTYLRFEETIDIIDVLNCEIIGRK